MKLNTARKFTPNFFFFFQFGVTAEKGDAFLANKTGSSEKGSNNPVIRLTCSLHSCNCCQIFFVCFLKPRFSFFISEFQIDLETNSKPGSQVLSNPAISDFCV